MHVTSILLLFSASVYAQNATQCVTTKPIFGVPNDGISTAYQATKTLTSGLDCRGCALSTQTFTVIVGTSPSRNVTVTSPVSTATSFECLPTSSSTAITGVSASLPSIPSPTASPLPPIAPTAQTLINELETQILFVSLIAQGGFLDQLCAAINPAGLSSISGINGTAIQFEVCAAADLQLALPSFAAVVVAENAEGAGPKGFLSTALYAVQLVAGFAGVTASAADIASLCPKIETTLINNLAIGFVGGLGDMVKSYVCSGGNST